jgi:superfamily II DNA or RNA helicase
MNALVKIFEDLSYPQVLDIAEEFYFHTDEELNKQDFERKFAQYLETTSNADEVISRYKRNPGLETTEKEKAVELFNFQVARKADMIEGFERDVTFLNASEPGTGKTFVALSAAETEKRPIIIVCPKQVMLTWYMLAVKSEVEILCICNYDMFITGNMYSLSGKVDLEKLPKVENPYLRRVEKAGRGAKKVVEFEWKNLPERTLIVFDEAHLCKNIGTLRTSLMLGAYNYAKHPENRWKHINILLMSATIIEKKHNLKPFMYVLGYANTPGEKSVVDAPDFSVKTFGYKLLAEKRMTRATMKQAREALGDFHTSDIRTKKFKLEDKDRARIQELCENIRNVLIGGQGKKAGNHLAVRMQARQEIEALKMGIFFSELKTQLAAGYAVAFFVNFIPSLEALISMIQKDMPDEPISVIRGGQAAYERLRNIDDFQNGKSRIIVAMIGAGGTGIGLHDVKGIRPHYGLHSPPESITQMIQGLGRLDRLGSKSNSVQRIVFIADTIEEKIADGLLKKMKTIGELNGEEDGADNLFLFEEIHSYDEGEPMDNLSASAKSSSSKSGADSGGSAGEIKVVVNKKRNDITVTVPDYMVDAFEDGLPAVAMSTMRIEGDHYIFSLDHRAAIQEFLTGLVQ